MNHRIKEVLEDLAEIVVPFAVGAVVIIFIILLDLALYAINNSYQLFHHSR